MVKITKSKYLIRQTNSYQVIKIAYKSQFVSFREEIKHVITKQLKSFETKSYVQFSPLRIIMCYNL